MPITPEARKGVFTFYPNKTREAVTINLTPEAHKRVPVVKKATGASRGDLLEHAFRKLMGMSVNKALDQAIQNMKR